MQYLTTAAMAAATGLSAATLRRMAKEGMIPGAIRLSGSTGAWRFPAPGTNDSTPPSDAGRGVSAESVSEPAHIMSGKGSDLLAIALRVAQRLDLVQARPARALKAALMTTVTAAARHYPDRDGWCTACKWQYPCTDAQAAHRIVTEAAAIVLDGEA